MMDEPENGEELTEEPQEREPGSMGLLDHLEELRWAVLKSMSAVLAGIVLTAFFFPSFFAVLRYPLDRAVANEPEGLVALTTTSVMGVFMVIIQVCMIGGVALGLPFVLYNFARFVAPGLTQSEKRVLVPACGATLILFLFGCLFAYFVVLPTGLEVTLFLRRRPSLTGLRRMSKYRYCIRISSWASVWSYAPQRQRERERGRGGTREREIRDTVTHHTNRLHLFDTPS